MIQGCIEGPEKHVGVNLAKRGLIGNSENQGSGKVGGRSEIQ